MQKRAQFRLLKILFYISLLSGGVFTILYNLQENIIFFYPPSKIFEAKKDKVIKVGGLVKAHSIEHISSNKIKFKITDNIKDLSINYEGILPALFREGQGVIASGKLTGYSFQATELLTKHDENYMPPEVAKSLINE